jgi:hypothetical protein
VMLYDTSLFNNTYRQGGLGTNPSGLARTS